MENSVCIIDWAGNHKYCGFWCDFFPGQGKVVFGGEWEDVPDLITEREPTKEECESHAEKYTSFEWS